MQQTQDQTEVVTGTYDVTTDQGERVQQVCDSVDVEYDRVRCTHGRHRYVTVVSVRVRGETDRQGRTPHTDTRVERCVHCGSGRRYETYQYHRGVTPDHMTRQETDRVVSQMRDVVG